MAQAEQVIAINKEKETIIELLGRLESGLVPDEELRQLLRTQFEKRLQWCYKANLEQQQLSHLNFIKSLKQDEIVGREKAALDDILYDMPITFLNIVFGEIPKESASYFREETMTIDEAVKEAHHLYCERAQIKDGHRVLDIGCGHGSFMFYVAQKYKNCHVTGITNSHGQKKAIEDKCRDLKLSNVEVILADATKFDTESTFDRIVLIESIEHMNNCDVLLKKISTWMKKDDGLLFVDNLCHKSFGHKFEKLEEEDDLFSAYLFPDGITIQAVSTLLYFQDDISIVDHWILNGTHMARTMEESLKKLDSNIDIAREALRESGFSTSEEDISKFITHWRTFFIAWIEQFNYNNGYEWMISQSLFKKK